MAFEKGVVKRHDDGCPMLLQGWDSGLDDLDRGVGQRHFRRAEGKVGKNGEIGIMRSLVVPKNQSRTMRKVKCSSNYLSYTSGSA